MKIKICGILNLENALSAIDAGADMLGFNFYPKSPRYITPGACAVIQSSIEKYRSSIMSVGVFVNSPVDEINAVLDQCGLDLAQLSGEESMETLTTLGAKAYKALHLSTDSKTDKRTVTDFTNDALSRYTKARQGCSPTFLVDAYTEGAYGGTGVTADWGLAAGMARRAPILLAGGLTPENVAAAVQQVHPWGVDVASGVEAGPGKKDPQKVRQFIQNARLTTRSEAGSVVVASGVDFTEILTLQKLAYRSEAELNNDFNIPPMIQTMAGIAEEFEKRTFLKIVLDGRIIGSVRAHLDGENSCHIGRVIVHPDYQNRGIGAQLMGAIEARFAGARRYELFTSERSTRNLYLYQKLGYKIFRRERMSEKVGLVYLEKGGDGS